MTTIKLVLRELSHPDHRKRPRIEVATYVDGEVYGIHAGGVDMERNHWSALYDAALALASDTAEPLSIVGAMGATGREVWIEVGG